MAAPRGAIEPVNGGFKVSFFHGGAIHEVAHLSTAPEAYLAYDLLMLQASIDKQLDTEALQLQSQHLASLPARQLSHVLCTLCGVLSRMGFPELVEELQACSAKAAVFAGMPGSAGARLLHAAALWGQISIAELVLVADPTAATIAHAGCLPLHRAAQEGHTLVCGQLLDRNPKAAKAACGGGYLPLHLAAGRGHTATVWLLLQRASSAARIADNDGFLPLHRAAQAGHRDVCRQLLDRYPQAALAAANDGSRPLHFAVLAGHTATTRLLLDIPPNAAMTADNDGCLPLHLAAHNGDAAICELLLHKEPQAAMIAGSGNYLPLHWAALFGHAAVCAVLLHQAPQAAMIACNDNFLPLHMAALMGHAATCRELLVHAQRAATRFDRIGYLPLHYAAIEGYTDVCNVLLETALCAAYLGDSDLPLHLAAWQGHTSTVRVLVACAPNTAALFNSDGNTPLQLALGNTHLDAARCLLAAGRVSDVVAALEVAGAAAMPLFGDLVTVRLPMTSEEWAAVPTPCPGIGGALPAVLAHSPEQARQLMQRLPPASIQRLRTAALSLHRAPLPVDNAWYILALSCVD